MSAEALFTLKNKIKTALNYVVSNKWKSSIFATSGTFLFLCSRFLMNKMYRRINNYPPGPEGIIPFIGFKLNTFLDSSYWHIHIAMTYGPIVYLQTYRGKSIIINDSKIAKQLLSRKDLNDRNLEFAKKSFNRFASKQNDVSFIQLNGSDWVKGRRLMSSKLIRMLNTEFVNKIFQQSTKTVFEPYLNKIIESAENPNNLWYPREIASFLTLNTIFFANFDESIDIKNVTHQQLMNDLQAMTSPKIAGKVSILYTFPFLKYFSWFMNDLVETRNRLNDTIISLLEKRRQKKYDNNEEKKEKTYIDITEELKESNKISKGRAIADIMLMFVAGTDTTAMSFEYGVILMAKQIDIQEKVRNELLLNAKNMSMTNMNDILYDINLLLKLPLFRAFIHEILRISCVTKLVGSHFISHDILINNYKLPKNSNIWINADYIHNYSKTENWRYDLCQNNNNYERKEICLENWLKFDELKNEYTFYQNESFLLFGYGKRDCVGKQLAMKELRILFGFLLINYKLSLKNQNQSIEDVGGRGAGISRFKSQIPVIIQKL